MRVDVYLQTGSDGDDYIFEYYILSGTVDPTQTSDGRAIATKVRADNLWGGSSLVTQSVNNYAPTTYSKYIRINLTYDGANAHSIWKQYTVDLENLTQPEPPFDPDDPDGPQCGSIDETVTLINGTQHRQEYGFYWWVEPDGVDADLDPALDQDDKHIKIELEGYTSKQIPLYYDKARWPLTVWRLDENDFPSILEITVYPSDWANCENFVPDENDAPENTEVPDNVNENNPVDFVDIADTRYQDILDDATKSDLAKEIESNYLMAQEIKDKLQNLQYQDIAAETLIGNELKSKMEDVEYAIKDGNAIVPEDGEVDNTSGTLNANSVQVSGIEGKVPSAPTFTAPDMSETVISVDILFPNYGYETVSIDLEDYSGPITIFRVMLEMGLGVLAIWYSITIIRDAFAK